MEGHLGKSKQRCSANGQENEPSQKRNSHQVSVWFGKKTADLVTSHMFDFDDRPDHTEQREMTTISTARYMVAAKKRKRYKAMIMSTSLSKMDQYSQRLDWAIPRLRWRTSY